jgi:hypothetical protein
MLSPHYYESLIRIWHQQCQEWHQYDEPSNIDGVQ